jgi:CDP-diacylglycerol--glycerol-3-phosphate 3-phosphatidyltransferase
MYGLWWWTFVLFTLAGVSDFFDGYLAKKYKVATKIGGVLDHIGDKLLVSNTLILLACMMASKWYIVIPIILLIARELYVSGLREFAGTQKMEMPVSSKHGYFSMGKVKAFFQMMSAGAFLLWFAIPSLIGPGLGTVSAYIIFFAIKYLPYLAIGMLWIALAASLYSAIEYTREFSKILKK